MWNNLVITLCLISLVPLILPEVASERSVKNDVVGLQERIKKMIAIIQDEDVSDADEEEQLLVKDTVQKLQNTTTQLRKVGRRVSQQNIDEWTKQADQIINEREQDNNMGRSKRSFWGWFKKFVRRVRWWAGFVCAVIRC